MPRIKFTFKGWVNGADVKTAHDVYGNEIDVSHMSAKELAEKLDEFELYISLGDHLYDNWESEIEMADFEEDE